jgi:hypothetical protein
MPDAALTWFASVPLSPTCVLDRFPGRTDGLWALLSPARPPTTDDEFPGCPVRCRLVLFGCLATGSVSRSPTLPAAPAPPTPVAAATPARTSPATDTPATTIRTPDAHSRAPPLRSSAVSGAACCTALASAPRTPPRRLCSEFARCGCNSFHLVEFRFKTDSRRRNHWEFSMPE